MTSEGQSCGSFQLFTDQRGELCDGCGARGGEIGTDYVVDVYQRSLRRQVMIHSSREEGTSPSVHSSSPVLIGREVDLPHLASLSRTQVTPRKRFILITRSTKYVVLRIYVGVVLHMVYFV